MTTLSTRGAIIDTNQSQHKRRRWLLCFLLPHACRFYHQNCWRAVYCKDMSTRALNKRGISLHLFISFYNILFFPSSLPSVAARNCSSHSYYRDFCIMNNTECLYFCAIAPLRCGCISVRQLQ